MTSSNSDRGDFWKALRTGLLLGGAALVIALPAYYYWKQQPVTTSPGQPQAQVQAPAPVPPQQPVKLAAFGDAHPTDAVRQVANWSVHSGDHKKLAIVIVDKKDARVWVFDPDG